MRSIWLNTNTDVQTAVKEHTSDLRAFHLYNRELLRKINISAQKQANAILAQYDFKIHIENYYRLLRWKDRKWERTSSMMPCYVIAHWWGLDPIFMITEGRKIIAEEDRQEREKEMGI